MIGWDKNQKIFIGIVITVVKTANCVWGYTLPIIQIINENVEQDWT